jgi:hypothetical protein
MPVDFYKNFNIYIVNRECYRFNRVEDGLNFCLTGINY